MIFALSLSLIVSEDISALISNTIATKMHKRLHIHVYGSAKDLKIGRFPEDPNFAEWDILYDSSVEATQISFQPGFISTPTPHASISIYLSIYLSIYHLFILFLRPLSPALGLHNKAIMLTYHHSAARVFGKLWLIGLLFGLWCIKSWRSSWILMRY
jgi:hypothetical protein